MQFLPMAALLITLALFRAAPASADTPGPALDCAQATSNAETTICKREPLRVRDWWLDLVYRDALALDPSHADVLKADQSRWLRERDALCGLPPEKLAEKAFYCLVWGYDDRIAALTATSIAPVWREAARDAEAALKVLQPLQGPLARVYADILAFALAKDLNTDFNSDLAERLYNSSSFWQQGPRQPVVIPCGLAERYPRLLLVGRPYFGNAMDTELPSLDCKDDDPVPPVVSRFLSSNPFTDRGVYNQCPDKDGSYFVSQAYSLDRQELRLFHFPQSFLSADFGPWRELGAPWPTNEAIAQMDWSGTPGYPETQQALAAYYSDRFKLPPAQAATAAARALWDNRFIGDPLPGCDEQ
jgi:uncharacterized protein YecT (DUF1311 family)